MPELPNQLPNVPLDRAQGVEDPLTPSTTPPSSFRSTATDPNLRVARVEVFQILAVDIGQLTADRETGLRALQMLRAEDELSPVLHDALIGTVPGCTRESRSIRERMADAKRLRGKAVWTNEFVDRFSPIILPSGERLVHNNNERRPGDRLSDDPKSPLHYVRLQSTSLKLFGDGSLTYTIVVNFLDRSSQREGGTAYPPASIDDAIERLLMIEQIVSDNFCRVLADFFRLDSTRKAIEGAIKAASGSKFKLRDFDSLDGEELAKLSEEHRIVFVENFYDDSVISKILESNPGHGLESLHEARVDLQRVVKSSSLAGLLNTATWYKKYNERYVQSLVNKEIGYKNDEIYITDRKATVICCEGFWNEGGPGSQLPDPLTRYKWDLVLAAEYCVSRLAYLAGVLGYYQDHPDVRNIENARVLDVLPRVIDGRAVVSHIAESLNLKLLVNHGFTRRFIDQLRKELSLDLVALSIRQRVMDTSQSVDLKSSVMASEHTSKENLRAALQNNAIQRIILIYAVASVTVAIILFLVDRIWP